MMVEYFDRLPQGKISKLRAMFGGELEWKAKFPNWSKEDKEKFGQIIFDQPVKNIRVTTERNLANGYDIPVIEATAA